MARTTRIAALLAGACLALPLAAQEEIEAVEVVRPAEKPKGAADLLEPVRLAVAGKVIDTDVGHAAPFVGDFDGDGVRDLLVGQFGEGILWIYRNTGTDAKPVLAEGVKFKQGEKDGRVPTG